MPIGRACANTDAFAVTADGDRVAKPGQEGELYVRGPGLMSGYWGDAEKTRQMLVTNPFQAAYAEPAYRTGDLVTLDEAGDWVFLGRRDGMVKTRGYRVELGEVETALYAHPAVREAVVLPVPDELLGNRLRAVISAEAGLDPRRDPRSLPPPAAGVHGAGRGGVLRGAAEDVHRQGRPCRLQGTEARGTEAQERDEAGGH